METCQYHIQIIFPVCVDVIAEDDCGSLTTRLPFDDDEFDHVHIKDIARGVPETKVRFSACVSMTLTDIRLAAVGLCVCSECCPGYRSNFWVTSHRKPVAFCSQGALSKS